MKRTFRRLAVAAAALGLLTGLAAPLRADRERLTEDIERTRIRILKEQDPEKRRELAEHLERCLHELGPFDAAGLRVHPKAMWRDRCLVHLEETVDRLAPRVLEPSPETLALEARYHTARMGAECLRRAWPSGRRLPKYLYDAFTQYCANNEPLLGRVFDGIGAWAVKVEAMPADAANRAAFAEAVAQARAGVDQMAGAYVQFTTTEPLDRRARAKIVDSVGLFVGGLLALQEAHATCRELSGDADTEDEEEATPAEEVGLGPDGEAKLARIREVAAILPTDDGHWADIAQGMLEFATLAEKGSRVPTTQRRALELLHYTHLLADYLGGLLTSKAFYPEYLARRPRHIAYALRHIREKRRRQRGYSTIRRMVGGDRERHVLEASPLSPQACIGYLKARRLPAGVFGSGREGAGRHYDFGRARRDALASLARIAKTSTDGMTPRMKPVYAKFRVAFLREVEAAGRATDAETCYRAHRTAGERARNLDLLLDADEAVKAVARYAPSRAGGMYAQIIHMAEVLYGGSATARKAVRVRMEEYVTPFRGLAAVEFPEREDLGLAMRLTAGSYAAAHQRFTKEVTAAIIEAARGSPRPLQGALRARYMFRLLRNRCLAERAPWRKMSVANLDAFSLPPEDWAAFRKALDVRLREEFLAYGAGRPGRVDTRPLAGWEEVYAAVTGARRLTDEARLPTDTDTARLFQNLAQCTESVPPDETWFGWAVGYHMGEAAVSYAAGYEDVAGWHRGEITLLRRYDGFTSGFTRDEMFDDPEAEGEPAE